jgi:hypothetical protein
LRGSLVKKPTFGLSDDPRLIARFPRKDEKRNFSRRAPLSGMRSMHTKNLYWGDSSVRILAGKAVPDNHVFSSADIRGETPAYDRPVAFLVVSGISPHHQGPTRREKSAISSGRPSRPVGTSHQLFHGFRLSGQPFRDHRSLDGARATALMRIATRGIFESAALRISGNAAQHCFSKTSRNHRASCSRILGDVVLLNYRQDVAAEFSHLAVVFLHHLAFHHCNSVDSRSFGAQRGGGRTNGCGLVNQKFSSFGHL